MSQGLTAFKKIKAFPFFMGESGCDYHRVRLPFIFAGEYYQDAVYKGFTLANLLEYLSVSELVVLNRLLPIGNDVLKKWHAKFGFKIVVDVDDWIKLPAYHPNYQQYKMDAARQIIECVQMADLVTVTTDRLRTRMLDYNKNVHVLPNALPYGHIQFTERPPKQHDTFNFIYTGQSSHLEDVRLMQADIKRASRLPGISFTMAGYKTGGAAGKVWHRMENVFNQGAPYYRIPAQPLDSYMDIYNYSDCSLVPLCVDDFNSCKSNLKVLEAACKKIPAIVSHVAPYRDDTDAPVLWVKQPGDWYKHMKYLTGNPGAAEDLGEQLHQWAKEKFDLIKWNRTRFELYQSIL